jgi:hypothetical protein
MRKTAARCGWRSYEKHTKCRFERTRCFHRAIEPPFLLVVALDAINGKDTPWMIETAELSVISNLVLCKGSGEVLFAAQDSTWVYIAVIYRT